MQSAADTNRACAEASTGDSYAVCSTDPSTVSAEASTGDQLYRVRHRHQHSTHTGLHSGPAVHSTAQTSAQRTQRPPQGTAMQTAAQTPAERVQRPP